MDSINVRVIGTANMTQMQGQFSKMEAQTAALNAELAKMVKLQAGVDGAGYARAAKAVEAHDKAFRNAVASTGMFEQAQVRVNSATDDFVKKLNAQKLSFGQMIKQQKVAIAAYKEQLAMESMVVKRSAGSSAMGKQLMDVQYTKAVSKELDTWGHRLAYGSAMAKSGAAQMINWGKNTQWAGRQLTVGFTMPLVAAGAAAGVLAYQVDKQLTQIAKVYNTTANANSSAAKDQMAVEKELAMVRNEGLKTATKSAKEYGQSVTDTLSAQAELAAAGLKGKKLQESTLQVMRISRLGDVDYQDTIKATIALQNTMKLSTKGVGDAFNYLNAIENSTSLTTQDFVQAIPIAAAPVKAFGGDIKELGTLLVAMKSQGIEATQGANAIKSAMQRLGRPSEKIQEEWTALTGTDITKIFKNAKSLQDMFIQIGHATDKLGNKEKIKAFSGLFGTYQVTRMMAMVNGLKDMERGYGQTAVAAKIAGQSAAENAKIAENELNRWSNSISGKFKRATETFKAQLTKFGEPFVEMATKIITLTSKIMEAFNGLPKPLKMIVGGFLGFTAVFGVVLMLIGLMSNLGGNILKTGANIVGLATKMKILDAESRVAQESAKLLETRFVDEATAIQLATASIEKYVLALQEANSIALGRKVPAATMVGGVPANGTAWLQAKAARDNSARASEAEAAATNKTARNMKVIGASGAIAAASMATMMVSSNKVANNIAQWALVGSMFLPVLAKFGPAMAVTARNAAMQVGALAAGFRGATAAAAGTTAAAEGMAGPIGWALLAVTAIGVGIYKWVDGYKKAHDKAQALAQAQMSAQRALVDSTKQWADDTGRAYQNYVKYNSEGAKDMSRKNQSNFDSTVEDYKNQTQSSTVNGQTQTVNVTDAFNNLSPDGQTAVLMKKAADLMATTNMSVSQTKQNLEAFLVAANKSGTEASLIVDRIMDKVGHGIKKVNWSDIILKMQNAVVSETNNPGFQDEMSKGLGDMFYQGLSQEKTPKAKKKFVDSIVNGYLNSWEEIRQKVKASFDQNGGIDAVINGMEVSDDKKNQLKDFYNNALSDAKHFRAAYQQIINSPDFKTKGTSLFGFARPNGGGDSAGAGGSDTLNKIIVDMHNAGFAANGLEDSFAKSAAGSLRLSGDVTTLDQVLNSATIKMMEMDKTSRTKFLKGADGPVQKLKDALSGPQGLIGDIMGIPKVTQDSANAVQEALNQGINFKDLDWGTQNLLKTWDKLGYIDIPNAAKNAGKAIHELGAEARYAAGDYYFNFKVNASQLNDVRKSAVQSIQNDMADMLSNQLEEENSAAMDAQANRFQKQQDALDAKWTKRKDQAQAYWDARIKGVQDEINAEQRAESQREKMFQAEMDRISRLNEAMNKNIDFNVALNSGNLDEAAKIRNDVVAGSTQSALQSASDAGQAKSQERQDKLQKRLDYLNKAQDKYMKRLDKEEAAEKKHLDRIQKAREKALQSYYDQQKETLDNELELFKSAPVMNAANLQKLLDQVGIGTDKFNLIMKKKGTTWASWYNEEFQTNVRAGIMGLASDNMWNTLGKESVGKMLKGMGFPGGMPQFKHFIATGSMTGYKQPNKAYTPHPNSVTNAHDPRGGAFPTTRHEGGWVDGGAGSRKGVARTLRGLHSSEQLVRAQKKEFIVNQRDAQANAGILERINNGEKFGTDVGGAGGAGEFNSMAPTMSALLMRGFLAGTQKALQNVQTKASTSSLSGLLGQIFGSTGAGNFAGYNLSAEQLRNAATIASVGSSMGMSKRDIEIGIMTAMTESSLHNLSGGDRDSIGLFQQRPSQGWGTPDQVHNPEYASRKFFSVLKTKIDRGNMSPWMAAQSVQRSAYSDGSNYEKFWSLAQAVFNTGLSKGPGSGIGGYVPGSGGKHRPIRGAVTNGLHDQWTGYPAVDFAGPVGRPVYAVADGTITKSYDIRGPLSSDKYHDPKYGPYGSYGRVIYLHTDQGPSALYAHLSRRSVQTGQHVKGGSVLGYSGSSGNSSGPHLHFGATNGPFAWLKTGGTVRNDNTPAILHKNERVLTAPLTKKLDFVVDALYGSAKRAAKKSVRDPGTGQALLNHKKKGMAPWNYPGMTVGAADSPYTWFDYVNPSSTSKSIADDIATGIQSATYNINWGTKNASTQADLEKLMKSSNVISLQEVAGKKRSLLKWLETMGWGTYSPSRGTALTWNKNSYTASDFGSQKLTNYPIAHNQAVYAKFKPLGGGNPFWQVSAHTIWKSAADAATFKRVRLDQYRHLGALEKKLHSDGTPVIMGGDFNRGTTSVSQIAKMLGMSSNRTDNLHNGIDQLFYSSGINGGKVNVLNKGFSSDHPAITSSFSIPGLKKGAADVRFDNTLANLHRGEAVLTRDINAKFKQGVENFASGGGDTLEIHVHPSPGMDTDELVNKTVTKTVRALNRRESRKPSSRRA